MGTGYEHRYAGFTREQCNVEAKRLIGAAYVSEKWQELPERLMELRKVASYAPEPVLSPAQEISEVE